MPPVGLALGSLAVGATGFVAGAGAAVGLSVPASIAIANGIGKLLVGVALTALSQAIAKPDMPNMKQSGGARLSVGLGEVGALSFTMGVYPTAGELVFHGSFGSVGAFGKKSGNNENYVQVFELADWPGAELRRVFINGAWADLEPETDADLAGYGQAVKGYRTKGRNRLWVKYLDGTQTAADPHLLAKFPAPYRQPWTSSMVGFGVPLLIVTQNYRVELGLNAQVKVLAETGGNPFYDPRKDSTAGGAGPQRLARRETWAPTRNPVVMIYNILLGVRDPLTDEFIWGGQGITQRDLPSSNWFAAMNECDRRIDGRPQYEAGLEVRVDEEPASVIEELLKACQGDVAEIAGIWTIRAGAPALPVYAFTDDDIVVTSPETFNPFVGLDAAYNGVRGRYPSPAMGWQPKDAPARDVAAYLAADGGRRNIASIEFKAVSRGDQVQRLMTTALRDARRMRKHALVMPPEARRLGPLDAVAWGSQRRGYSAKVFDLPLVEDIPAGNTVLGLRERDPSDYDFGDVDLLPEGDGFTDKPDRTDTVPEFSVSSATADGAGGSKLPGILLRWTPEDEEDVDAVRYRVRLASDRSHVPTNGQAAAPEATKAGRSIRINGKVARKNGKALTYSVFERVAAGECIITEGLRPATAYEVQAIYVPTVGREWSEWLPVTTPDAKLRLVDFEQEVRDVIDEARDNAQDARADALDAKNRVADLDAAIGGISEEVRQEARDLRDALAGIDGSAINDLTGIAVAGLKAGGVATDPTFRLWSGGTPNHWSGSGHVAFASRVTGAATPPVYYGSGMRFTVPAGAGVATLSASSDVAGQMEGANPNSRYMLVSTLLRVFSGSIEGGRMRIEWRPTGSTEWVRGHAFGATNSLGRLAEDYGLNVNADQFQSREVMWVKPFDGAAAAVRIFVAVKPADVTSPADLRFDYLNLRRADEAEQKAYLANGDARAMVDQLALEVVGPGGALAGLISTVRAEYGPSVAAIVSGTFATATALQATASIVETLSVSYGDQNLVRNPQFADGARPAGQAPNWWTAWPAAMPVAQRNPSGGVAVQTAPTLFFAEVPDDGVQYSPVAFERMPVDKGDVLFVGLAAAVGGAGATCQVQVRVEFRATPGAAPIRTVTRTQVIGVAQGWVRPVWAAIPVLEGEAEARMVVRRVGGGVGKLFFTQVTCRKGDPVALAEIETIKTTKVDAAGAIAAISTFVAADFGTFGAFVEQTATAIATAEGAASALVFRDMFGAIGLYAWANETGAGSAIKLDAANVLVPGTLTAGEISVMSLDANLVLDDQLQSAAYWSNPSAFQIIRATTSADSASEGEVRFIGSGSGVSNGAMFAVRAGQVLTCSAQIGRIGGSFHQARACLRFSERDGTVVSVAQIGAVNASATAVVDLEQVITVPGSARRAQFRWEVTDTNGNVRFFAPRVVRRSKGSTLITPDGAFFESLMVGAAWIGEAAIIDLSVSTLKIKGGALGRIIDATRNAAFSANAGWTNILTITMPANMLPGGGSASAKALVCPSTNFATPPGAGTRTVGFRLLRNGSTVWEEEFEYSNSGDLRFLSFTIPTSVGNGDSLQWQLRKAGGSGDVDHAKTYMSVPTLFQVS